MKKTIIISSILALLTISGNSQNTIDQILAELERNNTFLKANNDQKAAEIKEYKSDISIDNPEFEVNYLWGNPENLGNRTDISISQSIEFPSVYIFQNQISDLKHQHLDLEYDLRKSSFLRQARVILYELIHLNSSLIELNLQTKHAKEIADINQTKFDKGEINILQFNKAQILYIEMNQALEQANIKKQIKLLELSNLNGGKQIQFDDTKYPDVELPLDFEQWFNGNKIIQGKIHLTKQSIAISQKEEQLSKAKKMPGLSAGYMQEQLMGEKFGGISVGLSIPLWENKNQLKYAQAKTKAMESMAVDNKLQVYSFYLSLYENAKLQEQQINQYQSMLNQYDHRNLLKKSLEIGEISIMDYFDELSTYYKMKEAILEMDFQRNIALIHFMDE